MTTTPSTILARAKALIESFNKLLLIVDSPPSYLQALPPFSWSPPPDGRFKLNVDVVVKELENKVGIGAIVKNSSGTLMAATIKTTSFKGEVELAEAEALMFGIEIAKDARLSPLIIESDSLNVVKLVNRKFHNNDAIFWIISDIQALLANRDKYVVNYIPRSRNVTAHNLAKCALSLDNTMVWLEEIPTTFLL